MEVAVTEWNADLLARWFLAAFFCVVGAFYIVRINLLARKLDRPVTYKGEPGSLHWATHQTFRIFRALIFVICLARVPYPALDAWLVPMVPLWHGPVFIAGCLTLLASFGGIVAVNLYLKQEWRSGSRPGEPGKLITTGPYAWSQNPMMSLVMLGQLGFFLAMPSLFALVCLLVGCWAVVAQVGVERSQLESRFGEEYLQYSAQTPSWLLR
jgi:protein-S-isoprenylcysteine O-methyltransferase Ste14